MWKISSANLQNGNNSGWQQISDFSTLAATVGINIPSSARISAIAVAPSDPNIIYAAYEGPQWNNDPWTGNPCNNCPLQYRIFRTIDGGVTWTDITDVGLDNINGLEAVRWVTITDIVVNPTNPSELWVSFGGFNDPSNIWGRVMHSSDGGNTWNDYTNGLPEFPVNTIAYEKGSNDALYVGTDAGVFYTNKDLYQSQGWVCFNYNLPATIITDLEIVYAKNKIRAATLGRGLWESYLACPTNLDLNFTTSSPNLSNTFQEAENNITITANTGNINLTNFTARAGNEIVISATGNNEVVIGPNSDLFIHACNHSGNSFREQNTNSRGDVTPYTSSLTSSTNDEEKKIYESENVKYTYYPNPFTDHLHIDFLLEKDSPVLVSVYNSIGQLIEILAKGNYQTGEHTLLFNNPSVKSGLYFVRMDFGNKHYVKAVLKIKE